MSSHTYERQITRLQDADDVQPPASGATDTGKAWLWNNATGKFEPTAVVILGGKAGGQVLSGGTASGENLTLQSTSHATKGKIFLGASSVFDEINVRFGIGTTSPARGLHVVAAAGSYVRISTNSFTTGLDVGFDASKAYIWNYENVAIEIATNNTARMAISAGGDVSMNGALNVIGAITQSSVAVVTVSGAQTLTDKTLTTPTIGNFTNAAHTHQNAASGGQLDHGLALTGLTDDDHTQYALLAGRNGGQTLYGDTAANGDLVVHGTINGTKTTSYVILQPSGGLVAIGDASPLTRLDVADANASTNAVQNALTLRSTNAGTPAVGFGVGLRAGLKSSTTDNQDAGRLTWAWDVATHASRAAKGKLTAFYTSTEREVITWVADSTTGRVGMNQSSPAGTLHISSQAATQMVLGYPDSGSGYGEVSFRDETSGNNKWSFGVNSDSAALPNAFYVFQYRNAAETAVNVYRLLIDNVGNLAFGGTGSFGGGAGVLFVANAATVPTSNPSGGGVLYADAGAGKWRGSSGTVTTFANAEPHCPVCGRDYMKEFDNREYGYFAICLACLAGELGERPWIVQGKSRL